MNHFNRFGSPTLPSPDAATDTLRDGFAASALAGLLASWDEKTAKQTEHLTNEERAARIAEASYLIADAMLAARQPGTC